MSRVRQIREAADKALELSPADAIRAARGLGYSLTSRREGHPPVVLNRVRLAEIKNERGALAMWRTDNPRGGHIEIGDDPAAMLSSLIINRAYDQADVDAALKAPLTLSVEDGTLDDFVLKTLRDRGIDVDEPGMGWGGVFEEAFRGRASVTEDEAAREMARIIEEKRSGPPEP